MYIVRSTLWRLNDCFPFFNKATQKVAFLFINLLLTENNIRANLLMNCHIFDDNHNPEEL
jgi:hypothetical protein